MPELDRQKLNMQSSILWNSNSQTLVSEKAEASVKIAEFQFKSLKLQ